MGTQVGRHPPRQGTDTPDFWSDAQPWIAEQLDGRTDLQSLSEEVQDVGRGSSRFGVSVVITKGSPKGQKPK